MAQVVDFRARTARDGIDRDADAEAATALLIAVDRDGPRDAPGDGGVGGVEHDIIGAQDLRVHQRGRGFTRQGRNGDGSGNRILAPVRAAAADRDVDDLGHVIGVERQQTGRHTRLFDPCHDVARIHGKGERSSDGVGVLIGVRSDRDGARAGGGQAVVLGGQGDEPFLDVDGAARANFRDRVIAERQVQRRRAGDGPTGARLGLSGAGLFLVVGLFVFFGQ